MNGEAQEPVAAGGPAASSARSSAAIDLSDDEEWSSLVERAVLERTKSDRSSRADEDRRRRTIIIEKKNGTYGFTLQSYGIHYKREQEIEMVTYVDYVEYDGPAFKAGMREGDVILSINGQEMDRADHKTLVNFIKNCDSRMRMVVSFEDCVRKVELHMRYIELQRALQSRLSELERLCERERSILMGRWKTHSLPARKRTPGSQSGAEPGLDPSSASSLAAQPCCRPASSTEHLLLYSVYADGRSFLIPRSAACLVAIGPPRSRSDHHHFLSNVSVESGATTNATTNTAGSTSSSRHSYHQPSSNGLGSAANPSANTAAPTNNTKKTTSHGSLKSNRDSHAKRDQCNQESASLQPSARSLCVACISSAAGRRHRSASEQQQQQQQPHQQQQQQQQQQQADGGSLDAYDLASPCCDPNCVPNRRRKQRNRHKHEHASQTHQHQVWHHHLVEQQQQQQQQQQQRRSVVEQRDAQQQTQPRASGHSLHSIPSTDMSAGVESAPSCTTSLSTDTLYWDPSGQHGSPAGCIQYVKPKSWDNLATKAFGGYGFGYGYLDTAKSTHSVERHSKTGGSQHGRLKTPNSSTGRRSASTQVYSSRHFHPNKSTESLLGQASPYSTELDASLSCECLDGPNPRFIAVSLEKHKRQNDCTAQLRRRRSDPKQRSANSLEITRL